MTPWRRQLLWNLYTKVYAEFTRELGENPCAGSGGNPEMRAFLEGLPPRYLRIHSEAEMLGTSAGWNGTASAKGVAVLR